MTTPRYIVKRVGEDFQLKRCDPQHQTNLALLAVGGGIIALYGLGRGGVLGLGLATVGGTMAYQAVMGRNVLDLVADRRRRKPEGDSGPSFQHEEQGRAAEQMPQDEVEEASMESFPASDPPARKSVARE